MFYFLLLAPWLIVLILAITQLLTLRLLKKFLRVIGEVLGQKMEKMEGNPANTYEEDLVEYQNKKPKIAVEVLKDFTDEEVKLHEQPRLKRFLEQFKR